MSKRYRQGQARAGSRARRELEFATVLRQVKRNKARFTARLQRRVEVQGECVLYRGSLDHNGYPRINFRTAGGRHITIHAMRVFAMMMTCRPIPLGHDVGHVNGCTNRRCVRHVAPQKIVDNANTYHRRARQS